LHWGGYTLEELFPRRKYSSSWTPDTPAANTMHSQARRI
jgi:hypothetical protein